MIKKVPQIRIKEIKECLSTPLWAYGIILGLMLLCYLSYKLFPSWHPAVMKNLIYAIIGSLIVSILIDLGNTIRNKEIKIEKEQKASSLLASDVKAIYNCLGEMVAFLDNMIELFKEDEYYHVKLKGFYDGIFYYRDEINNTQAYYEYREFLGRFNERLQGLVNTLRQRDMYNCLNNGLIELIGSLSVEHFYFIDFIVLCGTNNSSCMTSIKGEFDSIHYFYSRISEYVTDGKKHKIKPLSEKEIKKYKEDIALFRKTNSILLEQIEKSKRV